MTTVLFPVIPHYWEYIAYSPETVSETVHARRSVCTAAVGTRSVAALPHIKSGS